MVYFGVVSVVFIRFSSYHLPLHSKHILLTFRSSQPLLGWPCPRDFFHSAALAILETVSHCPVHPDFAHRGYICGHKNTLVMNPGRRSPSSSGLRLRPPVGLEGHTIPPMISQQPPPSLPPIHQLHPGLPSTSQHPHLIASTSTHPIHSYVMHDPGVAYGMYPYFVYVLSNSESSDAHRYTAWIR